MTVTAYLGFQTVRLPALVVPTGELLPYKQEQTHSILFYKQHNYTDFVFRLRAGTSTRVPEIRVG